MLIRLKVPWLGNRWFELIQRHHPPPSTTKTIFRKAIGGGGKGIPVQVPLKMKFISQVTPSTLARPVMLRLPRTFWSGSYDPSVYGLIKGAVCTPSTMPALPCPCTVRRVHTVDHACLVLPVHRARPRAGVFVPDSNTTANLCHLRQSEGHPGELPAVLGERAAGGIRLSRLPHSRRGAAAEKPVSGC